MVKLWQERIQNISAKIAEGNFPNQIGKIMVNAADVQ